jgi:hypothetical protein
LCFLDEEGGKAYIGSEKAPPMKVLLWLLSLIACYAVLALFVENGVIGTVATIVWGLLSFVWLRMGGTAALDLAEDSSFLEESDYASSGMDMDASAAARGLARSQDRG